MAGTSLSYAQLFSFQVLFATIAKTKPDESFHVPDREDLEWRRAIMEIDFMLRTISLQGKRHGLLSQPFHAFKKCVELEVANDFFLSIEYSSGQWEVMAQNFAERECLYHLLQCVARDLSAEDAIQCGAGIVGLVAYRQLEFQVLAPNSKEISLLPADEEEMLSWINSLEKSIQDAEEILRYLVSSPSGPLTGGSIQQETVNADFSTQSTGQDLRPNNADAEFPLIAGGFPPQPEEYNAKSVPLENLHVVLDNMIDSIFSLNYTLHQKALSLEETSTVPQQDNLMLETIDGKGIYLLDDPRYDDGSKAREKSEVLLRDTGMRLSSNKARISSTAHAGSPSGKDNNNAVQDNTLIPINQDVDRQSMDQMNNNEPNNQAQPSLNHCTTNNQNLVPPIVIHIRISDAGSPHANDIYRISSQMPLVAQTGGTQIDIYSDQSLLLRADPMDRGFNNGAIAIQIPGEKPNGKESSQAANITSKVTQQQVSHRELVASHETARCAGTSSCLSEMERNMTFNRQSEHKQSYPLLSQSQTMDKPRYSPLLSTWKLGEGLPRPYFNHLHSGKSDQSSSLTELSSLSSGLL